jgi:hypothetical protein
MTSVVAETIELIKEKCHISPESIRIDDVVIGIFFTGMELSTGHAGATFTPIGEIPEAICCPTSAARIPMVGRAKLLAGTGPGKPWFLEKNVEGFADRGFLPLAAAQREIFST